jgi:5-methylcytosine-specific restriction endonuclease McrA
MTKVEIQYAKWCVEHDTHKFYTWSRWLAVREQVLKKDRYECQTCLHKYKRYRKATTVHHINHLKDRPELALEVHYTDPVTHRIERNLISLCHDCHEEAHGFRMPEQGEPLTEERWD